MQYQSRWYVSTQHQPTNIGQLCKEESELCFWPTVVRAERNKGRRLYKDPLLIRQMDEDRCFIFARSLDLGSLSNPLVIWWNPFYIWRRDFSDFVNESWFWSQQMHFGCERGIKLRSTASSWHRRTKVFTKWVCVFGNDDKRERARGSFWLIIFMMILYLVPSWCFHDPVIWDLSAK